MTEIIELQLQAGLRCWHFSKEGRSALCWGYPNKDAGTEALKTELLRMEDWARKNKCTELWGPIDRSSVYGYRLRIDEKSGPSFWGEPPKMPALIQALRELEYTSGEEYSTFEFQKAQRLRELLQKLQPVMPSLPEEIQIEALTRHLWQEKSGEILKFAHRLFSSHFAFGNLSLSELGSVYSEKVIQMMCEETSRVALFNEAIVGLVFNIRTEGLDHSPALLIKTCGVSQELRNGGQLFYHLFKHSLHSIDGNKVVYACMMRNGNAPSLVLKKLAEGVRSYALFLKRL